MKKNTLTLLLMLAITPFLVQCASQTDVDSLKYKLRIVNSKLDEMKTGTVGQMQKNQAASASQMDEMKREILALKGHLEESAHLNTLLREQNKELETSFQLYTKKVDLERQRALEEFKNRDQVKDEQLSALDQKFRQNEEIIKSIQLARVKDAEKRAMAAARAAEQAKAKARASSQVLSKSGSGRVVSINADKKKIRNPDSGSTQVASVKSTATQQAPPKKITKQSTPSKPVQADTGSGIISQADKEFANGNYQKAYGHYEEFTRKKNSGTKNITAQFMMGECLYHQKEYEQAILQYQKIISNHPQHPRAASALLKQGMSFEMSSDFETAKIIYKKIAAAYSSSPEAATAKERSAKLK